MKGERATRSHSFALELPAAEAFVLFEPEGERLWAHGWDPEYIHPADGRTEAGMVFTTRHGDAATLWTLTRHEPAAGLVEYVRFTPCSTVASVMVQCSPLGERRARVTVVYVYTGLSEAGNAWVRRMDDAHYRETIAEWERSISAALSRGARAPR